MRIDEAKKELSGLADVGMKAEGLRNKESAALERQASLTALQIAKREYDSLATAAVKEQETYKSAAERSSVLRGKYEQMNKAFLDERAGVLAKALLQGEPCPVCGSTEHPKPAALSEKAPTEPELNSAKKDAEMAEKATANASSTANNLMGQESAKKKELCLAASSQLGVIPFENITEHIKKAAVLAKKELEDIQRQLEDTKKMVLRKADLEDKIPTAEDKMEKDNLVLMQGREDLVSRSAQIAADKTQHAEQAEGLKFESAEKISANINSLQAAKAALVESYKLAQEAFNAAITTVSSTNAEISTLKGQLAESELLDIAQLKQTKDEASSKLEVTLQQSNKLSARQSSNRKAYAGMAATAKELSDAQRRYRWLSPLSETFNGNMSDKEKVKLETYIQVAYFEKVISKANIRLMQMSGAKFEFKRRNSSGIRSQSGLDLNFIDHHNGTEGNVKDLSGGEQFLASLALALGLSDEIQSNSGGIRLDSMFIDEGFGTLDGNALSQAIQALTGISQSNRLIAIISHVKELNERIDRQIIVSKGHSGSNARVVV